MEMVSYGAGINSTALAVWLIEQGWRGPVVMSDPGAEWPETYCYARYFDEAYLRPHGLQLTTIKGLPYQTKRGGISLLEYCEQAQVIPIASLRWCTVEYKTLPLQRWAAEHGIERVAIGIAAEESHRSPDAWRPLVDEGIDRRECIQIIKRAGLSVPGKSGCYICPFQRDSQWRELHRLHPALFERAARLEEAASAKTGRFITLDPAGKITLRQRQARYEAQLGLLDDATMDGLRAYQPCVCGL